MLVPLGFGQQSIVTSLGRMVYYTAEKTPWMRLPTSTSHDLPNLVFFHGFGGGSSAYEWSKVYPAFAAEYRILAPDLIGWGRSEHPTRNYQVEDYITTLIQFLEKTCGSATDVVASSLTGAIAIRAAIQRPDLFKSLILTTPAGLSDFGQDYSGSLFARIVSTPFLDKFLYSTGIATEAGIRTFLEQRQFAEPRRIYPEIGAAYLESASQPNAEYAALSFVRGDLCFDLSLYVPQLTTPTGIIWGEKSQFTGPEIGQRLANLNPEAIKVFQHLENVGLTPQLEVPAVTIGLIRQYLKLLSER
ncbi:MAG: alpha/beta hydrolase [Oscillatoriaceae cyanobacterium Prado104]|jgi:pimeloyl-ACP methyl ester carboxylesterase|nr:alpha/beta hydrolase [Oscillatoriaceae cyanobacterium Prado104]